MCRGDGYKEEDVRADDTVSFDVNYSRMVSKENKSFSN